MTFIRLDKRTLTDTPHWHIFGAAANALLDCGEALTRWWRARQAARQLADAPAEMLRDLGIARSDIERVVRRGRK